MLKESKVNGHTVRYYDSIRDTPLDRFRVFNLHSLVDSGVGSSIEDFDLQSARLEGYIKTGDTQSALAIIANNRMLLRMMISKVNPKMMSFAALVFEIDGVQYNDLSDEGLEKVISVLDSRRSTWGLIKDWLRDAKKKREVEMSELFPGRDQMLVALDGVGLIRKRTFKILEKIIAGTLKKDDEDIASIELEMLLLYPPQHFTGQGNFRTTYERKFEEAMIAVAKYVGHSVEHISVFRFHQTLEMMRSQSKKR